MQQPWTYTLYMYYLIHYNSPENREKRRKYRELRKPEENMQLLMILLLVSVLMTSCVTRKACERKYPSIDQNSTSIVSNTVTVYRDTTVYIKIPGDTVYKSMAVGEEISELKTPMARSYAWVKDGRLEHRLEERDTVIAENLRGVLRTTIKEQQQNKTIEKIKYVNKLTDWQILQIYLGRVLAFLIITILCLVLIKKVFLK